MIRRNYATATMKVSSAILFISAAWGCFSNTAVAQIVGGTVGDLPLPIANNILTILFNGTVQLLGNCSDAYDVSQVRYWLYNRQNANTPILLNTFDPVDANKPIIILIPGWLAPPTGEDAASFVHEYLQRYDCSVIVIDHSVYTGGDYQTAYCHVPPIGLAVAQFLCNMSFTLTVNPSNLHVGGHSLGAHIAGIAGSAMKSSCGILGRITGLDPAGPLYQDIDKSQRLDKSDALFVDVIHSNQAVFGYAGDLGRVDFYPNCGSVQPGCFNSPVSSLADIQNILVSSIACSHVRSFYLFKESINRNAFFSTSCLVCGLPVCLADPILDVTHAYMGESCRSQPPSTEYVLLTNTNSPYGLGPQGPLS